jgi:hypothetical protein
MWFNPTTARWQEGTEPVAKPTPAPTPSKPSGGGQLTVAPSEPSTVTSPSGTTINIPVGERTTVPVYGAGGLIGSKIIVKMPSGQTWEYFTGKTETIPIKGGVPQVSKGTPPEVTSGIVSGIAGLPKGAVPTEAEIITGFTGQPASLKLTYTTQELVGKQVIEGKAVPSPISLVSGLPYGGTTMKPASMENILTGFKVVDVKQQVANVYKTLTPIEKIETHISTLLSPSGWEYLGTHFVGTKTPEQVVIERYTEAQFQPRWLSVVTSMVSNPAVDIEVSALASMGAVKFASSSIGSKALGMPIVKAGLMEVGLGYGVIQAGRIAEFATTGQPAKALGVGLQTIGQIAGGIYGSKVETQYLSTEYFRTLGKIYSLRAGEVPQDFSKQTQIEIGKRVVESTQEYVTMTRFEMYKEAQVLLMKSPEALRIEPTLTKTLDAQAVYWQQQGKTLGLTEATTISAVRAREPIWFPQNIQTALYLGLERPYLFGGGELEVPLPEGLTYYYRGYVKGGFTADKNLMQGIQEFSLTSARDWMQPTNIRGADVFLSKDIIKAGGVTTSIEYAKGLEEVKFQYPYGYDYKKFEELGIRQARTVVIEELQKDITFWGRPTKVEAGRFIISAGAGVNIEEVAGQTLAIPTDITVGAKVSGTWVYRLSEPPSDVTSYLVSGGTKLKTMTPFTFEDVVSTQVKNVESSISKAVETETVKDVIKSISSVKLPTPYPEVSLAKPTGLTSYIDKLIPTSLIWEMPEAGIKYPTGVQYPQIKTDIWSQINKPKKPYPEEMTTTISKTQFDNLMKQEQISMQGTESSVKQIQSSISITLPAQIQRTYQPTIQEQIRVEVPIQNVGQRQLEQTLQQLDTSLKSEVSLKLVTPTIFEQPIPSFHPPEFPIPYIPFIYDEKQFKKTGYYKPAFKMPKLRLISGRKGQPSKFLPTTSLFNIEKSMKQYGKWGMPRGAFAEKAFWKTFEQKGVFMEFPTQRQLLSIKKR